MAGQPAAVVTARMRSRAGVPVVPGTNTVTIAATDRSGNTATATYEVDVADAPKTFTYDANGNLTSDGTRTFEWDARNQLVAVTVGTHRSEFVYDGLQRRVRQVEKDNGVTTADTRVLWCETAICEERAADGVTVTRRLYAQGEQAAGTARFFARDHLGSVVEVADGTATVLARVRVTIRGAAGRLRPAAMSRAWGSPGIRSRQPQLYGLRCTARTDLYAGALAIG